MYSYVLRCNTSCTQFAHIIYRPTSTMFQYWPQWLSCRSELSRRRVPTHQSLSCLQCCRSRHPHPRWCCLPQHAWPAIYNTNISTSQPSVVTYCLHTINSPLVITPKSAIWWQLMITPLGLALNTTCSKIKYTTHHIGAKWPILYMVYVNCYASSGSSSIFLSNQISKH